MYTIFFPTIADYLPLPCECTTINAAVLEAIRYRYALAWRLDTDYIEQAFVVDDTTGEIVHELRWHYANAKEREYIRGFDDGSEMFNVR